MLRGLHVRLQRFLAAVLTCTRAPLGVRLRVVVVTGGQDLGKITVQRESSAGMRESWLRD